MPAPVPVSAPQTRKPDAAQGVFETLLVFDGRPVELDAHLARLHASLAALFPSHPPPEFPPPLDARPPPGVDVPSATADGGRASVLRVTVAPGDGGALVARSELRAAPPEAFLPAAAGPRRRGAPATLVSVPLHGGLGAHKWADRSLLREAQESLPDGALPLLVDADGALLEASRANLIAVRGGALCTPPLDGRILPGVTRMRVLQLAGALGIETREAPLGRERLLDADEVFLTGAVRGVEPVRALDDAALAGRGPVGERIADALRSAWSGPMAAYR